MGADGEIPQGQNSAPIPESKPDPDNLAKQLEAIKKRRDRVGNPMPGEKPDPNPEGSDSFNIPSEGIEKTDPGFTMKDSIASPKPLEKLPRQNSPMDGKNKAI